MHLDIIDPFHTGQSALHQVDARVKLILAVAFILAVTLVPVGVWPGYILLFALIVAVAILSDLGATFAARRAFIVLPFVISAFPLLFTTEGTAILHFSILGWDLSVTGAGVARFISIVLKSWISVQAGILLAATTPFPQLLMAMRAVRIPRLLVGIFGLMWRYLFVLADEAMRLMRARDARSGSETGKGGGRLSWRAKVTGSMAGSLFLRGYERSERIYAAMLARGYDGEIRSLPLPPMGVGSWITLLVGLALLLAISMLNRLFL
jgi:cobalt/nickel transport system permease protein